MKDLTITAGNISNPNKSIGTQISQEVIQGFTGTKTNIDPLLHQFPNGTTDDSAIFRESSLALEKISPQKHYIPAVESYKEIAGIYYREFLESLKLTDKELSFKNTVTPLIKVQESIDKPLTIIKALEMIYQSSQDKEVADKAKELANDYLNEKLFLNKTALEQLKKYASSEQAKQISQEDKRHLEVLITQLERYGANLSPDSKEKISEIEKSMLKSANEFQENMENNASSRTFSIPKDKCDLQPTQIKKQGLADYKNTTVNLSSSAAQAINTWSNDSELKRDFYIKRNKIGYPDNADLINKLITNIRDRDSLLKEAHPNMNSYSDIVLKDGLLNDVTSTKNFLEYLYEETLKTATEEYQKLKDFKKEINYKSIDLDGNESEEFFEWDLEYLSQKYKEKHFDLDHEKIHKLFPTDKALQESLNLISQLYNIGFTEKASSNKLWDESVKHFDVFNIDGGEKIGELYLDLFYRDGKSNYPQSLMVSKSSDKEKSRVIVNAGISKSQFISNRDKRDLLHELGHAVHNLVSKTKYPLLSGEQVPAQTIELPSKFLENYASNEEFIKRCMNKESLSEEESSEIAAKLANSDKTRDAFETLKQIEIAMLDLELFSNPEIKTYQDLINKFKEILNRKPFFKYTEGTHLPCRFPHPFIPNEDYASQYFTYELNNFIAKFLHTQMKENPDINIPKIFKEEFMQKGNSAGPKELVFNLLSKIKPNAALIDKLSLNVA